MLRGLTTVFWGDDLVAAKEWSRGLLGTQPYFVRPEEGPPPAYIEFRIGDFEHELA